jgi:hypothetical protein
MPEFPSISTSEGTRQGEMLAGVDVPSLGLEGALLTFIRIDHQFRFQFGEVGVQIEGQFVVSDSGQEQVFDGERAGLGPVLAIYPDTLTSATVDPGGTLRLAFGRGMSIRVDPQSQWES